MPRLAIMLLTFLVQAIALISLLSSTRVPVASAQGEETPAPHVSSPHISSIELEMQYPSVNMNALAGAPGKVGISSHLPEVYTMPEYATVPAGLPRLTVAKNGEELGEGYYFVTTRDSTTSQNRASVAMMVNDRAQLVYYEYAPNGRYYDFKRVDDRLSYFWEGVNEYVILDNTYSVVETWNSVGYPVADMHDIEFLENGNVALFIYDREPFDMSPYGGLANAQVIHIVIQELDPDHNVVFEWDSRDYYFITDTFVSTGTAVIDYAHTNAIEEDSDGNFLISNRNMSEITKIDRLTGEIIWRLGGKNNDFTFIDDDTLPDVGAFSFQHDIRRLPNGNITIFDNANQFIDEGLRGSRGVEYELDESAKTATLIREFRTDPETYSGFMGSLQRLPNGNTVVGWGGGYNPSNQPIAMTEFNPDGEVILELAFLNDALLSYRARKFPWQGFPTSAPVLVVTGEPGALHYSWNGATEVVSYAVMGGYSPQALSLIAEQPKTDFEEVTPLAAAEEGMCFFQVSPSMAGGAESRASAVIYSGDAYCEHGLTTDNTQAVARSFTIPQTAGNVTATLNLLPGDFVSPFVLMYSPEPVGLASVPDGHMMSNVRFTLSAYQGEALSETEALTGETQLTIHYGALDLSRTPADVNLLRWDEASQSWSAEGLTLLERDVVGLSVTYQLHRTGTFALFVTNEAPQSAPLQLIIDEDEAITLTADLFTYFDGDDDAFDALVVNTLPVSGSLTLSETAVAPMQSIPVGKLSQLRYAPGENEYGAPYTSFEFSVSDGFTESVPYTLSVIVNPVNDAPVAVDDHFGILEEVVAQPQAVATTYALNVLLNDFDVDGDPLRVISVTQPLQGIVEIDAAGETLLYTVIASGTISDTLSYTIVDGHDAQSTATVRITIPAQGEIQFLPHIGR